MKHRRWNRFRAWFGGYFWIPCPLCNQMFGGHEWRDYDGNPMSIPHPDGVPGHGIGICPDCTRAGKGWYGDPYIFKINLN